MRLKGIFLSLTVGLVSQNLHSAAEKAGHCPGLDQLKRHVSAGSAIFSDLADDTLAGLREARIIDRGLGLGLLCTYEKRRGYVGSDRPDRMISLLGTGFFSLKYKSESCYLKVNGKKVDECPRMTKPEQCEIWCERKERNFLKEEE